MTGQLLKEPKGWSKKKIMQLCNLGRGRVISEEEIKAHTGIYPVYSSQTANKGEMGKIDTYDFEGEYVTWTTDGAYAGTVFYRSGRFNCTNVCGTLKSKDDQLSMKYLSYALSTKAQKHVSYVGNPKLMNNIMAEIELILPDNEKEQSKITEILSTVVEAIDKTEALIQKHQLIKQGLMQDLLTKGVDEKGNIRSEKTRKFKNSPLGRIPEEWEVVELKKIGTIFSGSTPDTNNKEFWGSPIVWITPDDLSKLSERYIYSSLRKITAKGIKHSSAKIIPANSIVVSSRAPIGYIAISKVEFTTNQGCKSIVLKDSFDIEFMFYNLKTSVNQMLNLGTGTTFSEITKSQLEKVLVKIPEPKEQKEISKILNISDSILQKEEVCKQKLLSLKHGLMEDLLTGKVRVNHLLN